ncbi:Uncharacterised protein [Moraxella bovis]|uniref:Uncharacterized protein n=1 Tax=Moraxella bovis TaxID=476 RepID=A0A378PQY2_MORBO|nr:Uncharacterised protein [Moraxella bovis]
MKENHMRDNKTDNIELNKDYRFQSMSLLFLIFFLYMGFYGNHQIADQLAKNPKKYH